MGRGGGGRRRRRGGRGGGTSGSADGEGEEGKEVGRASRRVGGEVEGSRRAGKGRDVVRSGREVRRSDSRAEEGKGVGRKEEDEGTTPRRRGKSLQPGLVLPAEGVAAADGIERKTARGKEGRNEVELESRSRSRRGSRGGGEGGHRKL